MTMISKTFTSVRKSILSTELGKEVDDSNCRGLINGRDRAHCVYGVKKLLNRCKYGS